MAESDSDQEQSYESANHDKAVKISSEVEPVLASTQTTLRDRRSRRLTAKYAEALESQTKRRRQRESYNASLQSLASPTVTLSTGEEEEENQVRKAEFSRIDGYAQTVRPLKRSRTSGSPDKIIEGKRKPKANLRLQGDFATLGPQGRWESDGRVYSHMDESRSDISSSAVSIIAPNRRQKRRSQLVAQQDRENPLIKVVDRRPHTGIQCSSPMSVIKHAARLAAVGVQMQDGTSPLMAASTATAEAYFSDGSSADGSNRLRPDCGNCSACRGMVAPCGRCHNCRQQFHYGSRGSGARNLPCVETVCQRRRHLVTARGEGPRVKMPVNFSAHSYQQAQRAMKHKLPPPGPVPQPSLFDTVPGLQEQIMNISLSKNRVEPNHSIGSAPPVLVDAISPATSRLDPLALASTNNLEVFADAPIRSLRGGDLGMYFAPHDSHNDASSSYTITPVEGEVIDGDTAYRGGFPVVTSSASAPPNDICYLCGSAGVDLRICVSCSEPFHPFCDRHQFLPKDKNSFLCCNCIHCDVCNQAAVELRCSECLCGFHPGCLPDYAPAQVKDRGKWVCHNCTKCVHCLVTPRDRQIAVCRVGDEDANMVPWSRDPTKCAACAVAEAKNNICPQCNRAYLEETVEMIECDSCHRWLHRACAKLSYDQYELIARAPQNQLRSFTVYCPPCKKCISGHSTGTRQVCDDEKLRHVITVSLTERMNTLIEGCKAFSNEPISGSSVQTSFASPILPDSKSGSHDIDMDSPNEYSKADSHIPQVDGVDDSSIECGLDPHVSAFSADSVFHGQVVSKITKKRSRVAPSSSWLVHPSLQPPPMYAGWLVERLNTENWITPKNLAYLLLLRLIARINKTPAASYDYLQLRRLLSWLSNCIELLFPWLEARFTVKEVRALLRQGQGSVASVVNFLYSITELELYELACPYIVAIMGKTRTRLVFQSSQLGTPRTLGFYRECIEQVQEHLTTHHADFEDCSRRFEDAQDIFIKQRDLNVYCLDPKTLIELASESFEESDGDVAIANFQVELFFKWQRLLHHTNRRSALKPREEDDIFYYFGLRSYWQALNEKYSEQMIQLPPQSSFDLDDSEPDSPDECTIRALPMETIIQEEELLFDAANEPRKCLLCARNTDNSIEDRLIYIGSDAWTHVNCALWSKEVFEEDSGQLTGLSAALRRGGRTRCLDCGNLGATLTCSNTEFCAVVVHFPCAMRRRKPTSCRPVFTADRSFFCSPKCHAEAKEARLTDAICHLRLKKLRRFNKDNDTRAQEKEDVIKHDSRNAIALINAKEITEREVENIKNQVDFDLESPELKEMLVCRRVFVPSDCFIASMRGDGSNDNAGDWDDSCDNNRDIRAEDRPYQSVLALPLSSNTLDFVSHKLPVSAFVVTIGALRIDRLGRIGEASDSLCRWGENERFGYLCPIGYRARRNFWSRTTPNARELYTLSVSQVYRPPLTQARQPNFLEKPAKYCSGPSPVQQHQPSDCQALSQRNLSEKRAMPVPVVITTSPDRIIPTPCSTRPVASSAFDPHPNNPVGLPSIRFTYPHGVPLNRLAHKLPVSSQQNSQPALSQQTPATVIQLVSSPPTLAFSNPLSPNQTVGIEAAAPPMSANNSGTSVRNSSPMIATSCAVQKSLPSQGHSLITSVQPPAPLPPKFANVVSLPHKASTPRIVSAVSVQKVTSVSKSAVVYSTSLTVNGGVVAQDTPVQSSSSIRIVEKRTPSQASIAQPTVVRCVSGGVTSGVPNYQNFSHEPRIVCQEKGLATTPVTPSAPHLRTVRVTKLSPLSTAVATRVMALTPDETLSQLPTQKLTDARLASQLDGIFSNIQSPRKLTIARPLITPYSKEQTDTSSLQQKPICIPQISQLDGIYDMGEFDDFPRRYGNNGASAGRTKKRWMVERENRLALNESVLKAKQAAKGRLYQKEVAHYANSYRLQFSASLMGPLASTPTSAWREVVNAVLKLREEKSIPHPIAQRANGWVQFGLSHRHVLYLLEQLPGAHTCFRYRFRYHRYRINQIREKYTPLVPVYEGSARLMPSHTWKKRNRARDPLDFLLCEANRAPQSCLPLGWPSEAAEGLECSATASSSSSCIDAARQATSIVASSLNLSPHFRARTVEAAVAEATADIVKEPEDSAVAAAGRARNQLSLTYQLQNLVTNREARLKRVAVHPSRIHKRGLFALCSYRPEELICEYTGELIRNIICERRETAYQVNGVDSYFFRIDSNRVIDATYAGNYARFINHSCKPNCDAKVLTSGDSSHIVIIAKRRILPGEELTYDYRFPKEADKLLCNCGRIGCRKYLN